MACVRKWRGSWVVDWRDPSGKRFIETIDGNRDAAERRLSEIVRTGKQPASKRLTFKDYAEQWLETSAKENIKDSTYEEYERSLKVHLYPLFESKPLVKVTREMVRQMIAVKKKAGLSRSTIRNILAPMRGMYNQAIEDGKAHINPAAMMGKHNKKDAGTSDKKISPLTREETQILLDKAEKDLAHYHPLFLCAARTGIREGELIALKGTDLDFTNRLIDVQRNISRGKVTLPKNGKTRKVDMSKTLAVSLNELLSRKRATALRNEIEKPAGERRDGAAVVNEAMENWLFTTPKAARLEPSNLRKVFFKLLTDAKLRRVRFHDLRHTFATALIEQGEGLAYVRDQMGHSSIKVTVDIYGHLVPGGNRQAVDKLDERVKVNEDKEAANS
jgi:integrase